MNDTENTTSEASEQVSLVSSNGSAAERHYTVKEIDALRRACQLRWLYGTTHLVDGGMSRQYQGSEKDKGVEQLIRTHMLAGHVAEDIYAEDKPPNVPHQRFAPVRGGAQGSEERAGLTNVESPKPLTNP